MSRRACPDCEVPLFAARKEGFRIDACGRCGGAWLDHVTAQHAIAERSLVPAILAEQASARASVGPPAQRARACPDCGVALVATGVRDARTEIDVCAEHGSWFDADEMRAVIEAIVRRRPPEVDPEVDRAIAREQALAALRTALVRENPELGDYVEAAFQALHDIARDFRNR
jgi:Zn-finger nucleic acid-binding protein